MLFRSKKRRRAEDAVEPVNGKLSKRARVDATKTNGSATLSRTAQVWFDQDFFKAAGLSDIDDDDDNDAAMESQSDAESDVNMDDAGISDQASEVEEVSASASLHSLDLHAKVFP